MVMTGKTKKNQIAFCLCVVMVLLFLEVVRFSNTSTRYIFNSTSQLLLTNVQGLDAPQTFTAATVASKSNQARNNISISNGNISNILVNDVDETGHDFHRLEKLTIQVKVPSPIFCLTLPKGGSTSIHQYFECGLGVGSAAHNHYPYAKSQTLKHIGLSMRDNIDAGKPLLAVDVDAIAMKIVDSLDTYQIFSDYDYFRGKQMFSMIDSLDNIATYYPNSTILYVRRNTTDWYQSAKQWGSLLKRFRTRKKTQLFKSLFPQGVPKYRNMNVSHWTAFYDNYSSYIRNFTRLHPSLTYIEIPLDINTGIKMEERFGISEQCWGHKNRSKKEEKKGPTANPRYWNAEMVHF